jgi:hypothetical protein
MPHRTPGWIWASRALAATAVAGLGGYLIAAGTTRANLIAAPAAVVIAFAALLAPYLLSAYTPPATPETSGEAEAPDSPAGPGVMIIADHGSVAAQHIDHVTMNPPGPDSGDTLSKGVPAVAPIW